MFSKSRHFTVNAGVCNNVNGSMYNYTTIVGDSERDGLEDYEPDEIELIPRRDIKLRQEIGSGPGYLLHSGTKRGRAVIVKVFNTHPNARERLEATLAMSKMLMHSNVLQVEGISIPSSMHHFIAYENVHWKNADGPLAYALKEDGDRSLRLAFTMVAQFAAALSYLDVHGFTVANMNVQNFDVLLDLDDRFVLSVNPESTSTDIVSDEHSANGTAWDVFNALCAKVLRSANHVIYAQEIEREPVAFEKLASATSVPGQKLSPPPAESGSTPDADQSSIPDSTTRREYVWRDIDQGTNSLSDVASRMSVDLGFELVPVNRLTWADTKSPHRCPGYVREEITVATSKAASAIVSRDAPGPLEICPICQEVVSDHEEFLCVCGDPDPGARPTIKCITCKNWSHANCVGNPKRFTCQACMMADTSSLRRGVRTDTDNFMNNTESMMIANGLKVLGGGHGGGGGEGKKGPGGAGGNGLGPRLAPKYLKDWDVNIGASAV
ncbi:hypothetical protein B0H16DRAFT_1011634 [Mycena metata]|uniref:Zinc finger PHD-type domain-containing protein n=1 Tax=Mycena metata TaxID=1033252 RepID=A0AAD7N2G2_9AGAR|nr:hypothetical protein B0H16DRAFT_701948 [Mycena metata]KAJ7743413.1 hypothetical protein B0H16DRAFT_1011634 [Mycena metata]